MFLIATDEAGYGPKLGPLVVAATLWQIPDHQTTPQQATPEQCFRPLQSDCSIDGVTIRVDDSKAVYQPSGGLSALHAIVSASAHWCGMSTENPQQWLHTVAQPDRESVAATPWLCETACEPFATKEQTKAVIDQWRSQQAELVDVKLRSIAARHFNQLCDSGLNKSDLLSQTTLQLVRDTLETLDRQHDGQAVTVFCDRHGGRRYYAAVIQHLFPETIAEVVSESKTESVYRCRWQDRDVRFAFTVKGDRFTPVAMSSLHAKYARERYMQSLNAFFAKHHQGDKPLKPTAGYPVDADRFLNQIESTVLRLGIADQDLVRSR